MITHRIANVALVVTATMFVMSLAVGIAFFQFYAVVALLLAGTLMDSARNN